MHPSPTTTHPILTTSNRTAAGITTMLTESTINSNKTAGTKSKKHQPNDNNSTAYSMPQAAPLYTTRTILSQQHTINNTMFPSSILPIDHNRSTTRQHNILNRSNIIHSSIKSSISPNHLNISAIVSTASSKKRPRASGTNGEETTTPVSFDKNLSPSDYARSAFLDNGVKDPELITKDCDARFLPITAAMMEAYHTEILNAVRANDLEKAQTLYREGLFQHGCNACNRFGESILHIACRRGNLGMVKFLVEEVGLCVTTLRDDYHRTPLHDAFWTSTASYEVVDFLLQQPHVTELLLCKDKRGFTPLDYTRGEDRSKWLAFLWERRATLKPYGDDVDIDVDVLSSSSVTTELNETCPSDEESPSKRLRLVA